MTRGLVATLLLALVIAGIVACTRVVVLEPGLDAGPSDDASQVLPDAEVGDTIGDAAPGIDSV
jgi:hypothetical protein